MKTGREIHDSFAIILWQQKLLSGCGKRSVERVYVQKEKTVEVVPI